MSRGRTRGQTRGRTRAQRRGQRRGQCLRARARRIAAVTTVAAVFTASGVIPLAAAAKSSAEEPPAVDIPLFGQPAPKAPKAKKEKKANSPKAKKPSATPKADAEPRSEKPPGEPPAKGGEPVDEGATPDSEPLPEAGSRAAVADEAGDPKEVAPGPGEPSGEPKDEVLVDPDAAPPETDPEIDPDAVDPDAVDPAAGVPGGAPQPPSTAGGSEPTSENATAAAAAPAGQGAAVDEPRANEGPVTVTTKVSPDPSFVGDRLTLEIIAAYPKGYRVNLPTGVDFSPLHLVSIEEGEPEPSAEGYFRKVFTVTLQHFDVGESKVPGFPLTYVGKDGEVETVRVAPRPFLVDSLLANEADPQRKLEDPPISLEYPNTTAELVIYSAAVAMLAGFFLALFWRRFASRRKVVAGPPPVPAHEIALSALEELEQSEFLETGLVQDYYLELTEIAKGYLEGRFGVDALDRTTDEIRRDLVRHRERIKPLEPDDVLRFLEGCDLVKFARFDPELDEARSALSEVRTMVEETVPTVSPAATGEAGEATDAAGSETEPGKEASEPQDAAEKVATTDSGAEASSLGSSEATPAEKGDAEGSGRGESTRADGPAPTDATQGSDESASMSPATEPVDDGNRSDPGGDEPDVSAAKDAEPASLDPASGDGEVKT